MNFKTIIGKALAFGVLFSTLPALASTDIGVKYYGKGLCNHPDFYCTKVERGGRWTSVFPDPHQRDIVQRVNRTYNWLPRGKVLAIPKNIDEVTIFDVSPFPLKEDTEGEKQIIVDQEKLAWGAYDENGALVNWGPISSGKDYCPDIAKGCRTKTGVFRFLASRAQVVVLGLLVTPECLTACSFSKALPCMARMTFPASEQVTVVCGCLLMMPNG
jgi:hypothetical protein